MKKNKVLLFAALAAMLVSCGSQQGKPNFGDNEYAVITVETQSSEMETTYPATIQGSRDVEIRPKIAGFITKKCVEEGQVVKQGQTLFVIDNVTYEAAARQAKAAVNAAQAQLSTAKLTYENNEQLFKNNVIGSYELESAKNAYESAKAALAQAQANYTSAKQNLDFCYVTSPSNGVVGDLPYEIGALVSSSNATPLTVVSDINEMKVFFSMTEKDLLNMTKTAGGLTTSIKDYPPVKLKLADGSIYPHDGKVASISGVIDKSTGAVSVKTIFPNPEHVLKSGGSGSIVVPHSDNSAILIPQDAVVQVQDKNFVYVLGGDNKVKYTEITISPNNDGQNYLVTSGLKVGDKIVAVGVTTLNDGMEIKPITMARYQEKIKEAQKLGEAQGDAKKLKQALGGK